jgi:hypothetical protein
MNAMHTSVTTLFLVSHPGMLHTSNVYRRQPSHTSLVTDAAMIFRNQDVTGIP